MDFIRKYHWEYGTSSIKFNNEQSELAGCKVLTNDDTSLKYGYIRVTIRLSREMIGRMKKLEKDVNEVLVKMVFWGFDKVTIVYGNRVYAKKTILVPHPTYIQLRSIYINKEKKPVVQMWLV